MCLCMYEVPEITHTPVLPYGSRVEPSWYHYTVCPNHEYTAVRAGWVMVSFLHKFTHRITTLLIHISCTRYR